MIGGFPVLATKWGAGRDLTAYLREALTDPYMRFWLAFVEGGIDLIERDRGALLLERFERSWPAYRGRAIEPLARESIEQLLPDAERFGSARHVGAYWNRIGTIELDLVGGDERPVAKRVAFLGSIKWRQRQPFERDEAAELAARRADVPTPTRTRCWSASAPRVSPRTCRWTCASAQEI